METTKSYLTFEDLDVHKAARAFRRAMYDVAQKLSDAEKYGLASQIRRAAVSLTNNIAEGHGRYHYLEQIKFMFQARGSLQELMDDLTVCEDQKYLSSSDIIKLKEEAERAMKLLKGYVRFLRGRKIGESSLVRESSLPYEFEDNDPFNDSTF